MALLPPAGGAELDLVVVHDTVLWGEAGKDSVAGGEGQDVFVMGRFSSPGISGSTDPVFVTSGGPDIGDDDDSPDPYDVQMMALLESIS